MNWSSIDPRPIYLPPGVELAGREYPPLELRLLWWVGRARWIDEATLGTLCDAEPSQVRWTLWRLQGAEQLRLCRLPGRSGHLALLTNGGLTRLAEHSRLGLSQTARVLGWKWERQAWPKDGPGGIADRWFRPGHLPGAHRQAVLRLLGWLTEDSAREAFWQVSLEEVWLEHETARMVGQAAPRPDACVIWRLRQQLVLPFFLEVETGTQRPGAVAEKIWGYAHYGIGARCEAIWGQLPGVLVVCSSRASETRLAAVIAQVNGQWPNDGQVPVLLTHQGWLQQFGLLDAIWRAPEAREIRDEERGTIWGRDDAALMQYRRQAKEQARPISRYRHAARDWEPKGEG